MNTKLVALVSITAAASMLTACKCCLNLGSSALHVVPTANDTNAAITIRAATGVLGTIERLDPALDALLAKDAVIEKLAEGFDWSEGPVWMPGGYLLFPMCR